MTLIVKNEEANLLSCLGSARELVNEIIVVDSGSTDRTKEVATMLGAKVFDFVWVDSFAAARNESLRHATGDWILWLDGDEYFAEENRAKLKMLFDRLGNENVAYSMKQRSLPDIPGGTPTVVDQVRLFPNHPGIRWSYRVHEQILPALRKAGHDVRFTDICIEHTGYVDPATRAKKSERNLRLLLMENAEKPDDPFTLFNLGWAYRELGRTGEAIPFLRRSLELSAPGDSITRKLYTLLAGCHRQLRQYREALAWCRAGRARCPDDAELLFSEGQMLCEVGDLPEARSIFQQLERMKPSSHFASVDAGLRGYKTRHQLALIARGMGNFQEAEGYWQKVLEDAPDFLPARLELGELLLQQERWQELDEILDKASGDRAQGSENLEMMVLRARRQLARKEFARARELLAAAIGREPRAIKPRMILTHVLLQENKDPAAAEQALRDLLELEPRQPESWRNLGLLLRSRGKIPDAVAAYRQGYEHCPNDPALLLQYGLLLRETGDEAGAEPVLVKYLEFSFPQSASNGKSQTATARHYLALVYMRQRRFQEAEAQWRAVLAEQQEFPQAWLGLAEVFLETRRWEEFEEVLEKVEQGAGVSGQGTRDRNEQAALEAAVLRARRHLALGDYAVARPILEETIGRFPHAIWPRVILSRALLQEGADAAAADRALREVLILDSTNAEAKHNLGLLLGKTRTNPQSTQTELEEQKIAPSSGNTAVSAAVFAPFAFSARTLRIAFACYNPMDFRIDSVYERPLGGSESALCYLAEALGRRGHDVFLLNRIAKPEVSRGVHCLPLDGPVFRQIPALDTLIVNNMAGEGRKLRSLVGPRTGLVLWTGHAHDQPGVQALADQAEREAYDRFALVSDWQKEQFIKHFDLRPDRIHVLRYGIAPAFQNLFPTNTAILKEKSDPQVLAYTSTPYRGLELLLEAFPRIRQAIPGTRLKIFSSIKLYGVPDAQDQARFGGLYRKFQEIAGVEYLGSVPQPRLAQELRSVSVLAYPNTYAETACIAVLEAMAAGCYVVTSRLGALPETTANFARLIPLGTNREAYLNRFVEQVVQVLTEMRVRNNPDIEKHLRRQVFYVNENCTWPILSEEWLQLLSNN